MNESTVYLAQENRTDIPKDIQYIKISNAVKFEDGTMTTFDGGVDTDSAEAAGVVAYGAVLEIGVDIDLPGADGARKYSFYGYYEDYLEMYVAKMRLLMGMKKIPESYIGVAPVISVPERDVPCIGFSTRDEAESYYKFFPVDKDKYRYRGEYAITVGSSIDRQNIIVLQNLKDAYKVLNEALGTNYDEIPNRRGLHTEGIYPDYTSIKCVEPMPAPDDGEANDEEFALKEPVESEFDKNLTKLKALLTTASPIGIVFEIAPGVKGKGCCSLFQEPPTEDHPAASIWQGDYVLCVTMDEFAEPKAFAFKCMPDAYRCIETVCKGKFSYNPNYTKIRLLGSWDRLHGMVSHRGAFGTGDGNELLVEVNCDTSEIDDISILDEVASRNILKQRNPSLHYLNGGRYTIVPCTVHPDGHEDTYKTRAEAYKETTELVCRLCYLVYEWIGNETKTIIGPLNDDKFVSAFQEHFGFPPPLVYNRHDFYVQEINGKKKYIAILDVE